MSRREVSNYFELRGTPADRGYCACVFFGIGAACLVVLVLSAVSLLHGGKGTGIFALILLAMALGGAPVLPGLYINAFRPRIQVIKSRVRFLGTVGMREVDVQDIACYRPARLVSPDVPFSHFDWIYFYSRNNKRIGGVALPLEDQSKLESWLEANIPRG